jgi:hypothetical protein
MTTPSVFITQPDGRVQADKDVDDEVRYWRDVSGLLASGDTISTVTGTAEGVTLVGTVTQSAGVIQFKISGGTPGQVGSVTLEWVTAGGDTMQRTLYFMPREL